MAKVLSVYWRPVKARVIHGAKNPGEWVVTVATGCVLQSHRFETEKDARKYAATAEG